MIEFSLIPFPIILSSVFDYLGKTGSDSLKLQHLSFGILKLDFVVFDQVRLPELKNIFAGKFWYFLTDRNFTRYISKHMTFIGLKLSDQNCLSDFKISDDVGDPIGVVIIKNDGLNLKVFCFLLKSFLNLLKSELGET